MTKILEVRNLEVALDGQKIIENLSFDLFEGEILTILGPNGAGKSVLIKTILGLIPHKGSIVWHKKVKVGYLPQGLTQLSLKNYPITVEDFFRLKDKKIKREEIIRQLEILDLKENIIDKVVGKLSGGQFQRMLIAWVLISKPKIIFFDEPTTGIDTSGEETIYSLLKKLKDKEKISIILITHDLSLVYKNSDNVLCISKRGHSCYGKPKQILTPQTLEEIYSEEVKAYKHNE
ncbi:MAG: zinc ABC transporter ATP-binding protein [Patescibacteria group bacterium]|nr:MAG: zinc ABC transporter ATP-binding protein [Patescibacteria group bacterium]